MVVITSNPFSTGTTEHFNSLQYYSKGSLVGNGNSKFDFKWTEYPEEY